MCMDHSIVCKRGRRDASFNFKNGIMPPEAIEALGYQQNGALKGRRMEEGI